MNDKKWADAPELATHMSSDPEVYYPIDNEYFARQHNRLQNPLPAIPHSSFDHVVPSIETPSSAYPQSSFHSYKPYTYDQHSSHPAHEMVPPIETRTKQSRQLWGCSSLVLVLSIAVAILLASTIGLAAGTAVQTNRANSAESKLTQLMSNTANQTNQTSNAATAIDGGCLTNPNGVSGSNYTSNYSNNKPTYTIFCNNNAPNPPLLSLFVGTLYDCIDACALYTAYIPGNYPNYTNPANGTCSGVSFVPAWTNRTAAQVDNAPGNCYLKPGPQNTTALTAGEGPDAVIAAILA
ncbi:hypothetical protein F5Y16DRAFT_321655 [Xylariaceae sp. FL0255]|nr:hypothetical protein F5Y16DRAFT_321655 [Xylariaceae sp. FL0255]